MGIASAIDRDLFLEQQCEETIVTRLHLSWDLKVDRPRETKDTFLFKNDQYLDIKMRCISGTTCLRWWDRCTKCIFGRVLKLVNFNFRSWFFITSISCIYHHGISIISINISKIDQKWSIHDAKIDWNLIKNWSKIMIDFRWKIMNFRYFDIDIFQKIIRSGCTDGTERG